MPIYEYHSPKTNKIYQFYSPSIIQNETTPKCPDGQNFEMIRMVSGFSITGQVREQPQNDDVEVSSPSSDNPFEGMEPQKANHIMSELEKSMGGLDDDNPDPRQMGSMMRRLCEMAGEKVDEPMEEVLRKLEEGVSPDKIEENMGDVLGNDEGELTQENDLENSKSKGIRKLQKKPIRDPVLYDFRDYA